MLLTNLNSISRYERMRRRPRPVIADVDDVVADDPSSGVDHNDGSRGLRVQRRPGEAARRAYRRRRAQKAGGNNSGTLWISLRDRLGSLDRRIGEIRSNNPGYPCRRGKPPTRRDADDPPCGSEEILVGVTHPGNRGC